MQVFLDNLGLRMNREEHLSEPRDLNFTGHIWKFLDISTFHNIIIGVCADDASKLKPRHSDRCEYWNRCGDLGKGSWDGETPCKGKCRADEHLIYAACFNTEIMEYIIRVIEWKYSSALSKAEAFTLAIDLIPPGGFRRPVMAWILRRFYKQRKIKGSALLVVLKGFLRLGVDPNKTKLWRTVIWDCLEDEEEWQAVERLEALIEAGANIDGDLMPAPSFPNTLLTRRKHLKIDGPVKPVDVAVFLKDPTVLYLLLRHGVSTVHFPPNVRSLRPYTQYVILPEFIEALRGRDISRIQELWNHRVVKHTISENIYSALKKTDLERISSLVLQSDDPLLRFLAFQHIAEMVRFCSGVYYQGIFDKTQRKPGLDLLQKLLQAGLTDPGPGSDRSSYDRCLSGAIEEHDIELVDLLLDFEAQVGLKNHPRDLFQGDLLVPVYHAAKYSLKCLEHLAKRGVDINESCIKGCYHKKPLYCTALSGAIESDRIENLAFVLKEGANIYAPCGFSSSAVVEVVSKGRIDAVALFLEVDPTCHTIALEAAQSSRFRYLEDYIRDWKPGTKGTVLDTLCPMEK
ncbi:hypothetical protein ABW20_dc0103283 [Dactylellina cionopaga]|nr:hypothetical protein ABW20_dc0103283 [Dactylellina cionopaga]